MFAELLQLGINIMKCWSYVNLTVERSFVFTFVFCKGESICSIIFKINNASMFYCYSIQGCIQLPRWFPNLIDLYIGAESGGAVPATGKLCTLYNASKFVRFMISCINNSQYPTNKCSLINISR